MRKFNVYHGGLLIDSVFVIDQFNADEVKRSLVDHDGLDAGIDVIDEESDPNVGTEFEVQQGKQLIQLKHSRPTHISEVKQSLIEDDGFPEDIKIIVVA